MSADARLVRRYGFRASHHYGYADLSEEENRRRFGDQALPHVHDWTVEVEVVGPVDGHTGFIVDLGALDDAVRAVVGHWEGGDLNRLVPEVREGRLQPSTEALARWLHGRLRPAVPAPARLDRVRVFESSDLGSQFPA